ncbi:hypothetical protein GCHA_3068 [Paraglaciecola chathamensis S18K6]|uniref:Transposase n=1 Tax=Paraglaciecola chathamensis S18K6 TaxID=1127672 RepID=A0AAV3V396_9ALTE|nr:hypothetical protein GCHA_3068 [Paraglaciecola chathamensis S18K6]
MIFVNLLKAKLVKIFKQGDPVTCANKNFVNLAKSVIRQGFTLTNIHPSHTY